jgi:3-phosphoshikimate 1-carboxyvinyltransferase
MDSSVCPGGGTGIRRFETDFVSRLNDSRQLPSLELRHWPESHWQFDERFPAIFSEWRYTISRETELGDSIMTAIVLAPLAGETRQFTDLGRLRVQECERVLALRTELVKCGARVEESGDTLTIYPSNLHSAEVETYNDHRMAMCFAILGLKVPGIKIKNPACVKKTFPNFFQKLAAPPPDGLGATILDPRTGQELTGGNSSRSELDRLSVAGSRRTTAGL